MEQQKTRGMGIAPLAGNLNQYATHNPSRIKSGKSTGSAAGSESGPYQQFKPQVIGNTGVPQPQQYYGNNSGRQPQQQQHSGQFEPKNFAAYP